MLRKCGKDANIVPIETFVRTELVLVFRLSIYFESFKKYLYKFHYQLIVYPQPSVIL
jgi:hypothetical protein